MKECLTPLRLSPWDLLKSWRSRSTLSAAATARRSASTRVPSATVTAPMSVETAGKSVIGRQ